MTTTWRNQAACRNQPVEHWYPGPYDNPTPALATCHTCPVQQPCLTEALDHRELFGIRGGTTEADRRRLRRHASRAEPAA